MTQLRQRMQRISDYELFRAHSSHYTHTVAEFATYFHKSPDQLGPEHIRTFLLHSRLVTRHSSVGNAPGAPNGALSGYLKQVLAFVEDQLAEDLPLDKVASVAGLSSSHTRTLFRPPQVYRSTSSLFSAEWNLDDPCCCIAACQLQRLRRQLASRTRATWRGICVRFSASHLVISGVPLNAPKLSNQNVLWIIRSCAKERSQFSILWK
jgi:hypothetical protein